MTDLPPITIELDADGDFLVTHTNAQGATHATKLPFDLEGLACLHNILSARAKVEAEHAELNTPAAPTQALVDTWLKANKPTSAKVHEERLARIRAHEKEVKEAQEAEKAIASLSKKSRAALSAVKIIL